MIYQKDWKERVKRMNWFPTKSPMEKFIESLYPLLKGVMYISILVGGMMAFSIIGLTIVGTIDLFELLLDPEFIPFIALTFVEHFGNCVSGIIMFMLIITIIRWTCILIRTCYRSMKFYCLTVRHYYRTK